MKSSYVAEESVESFGANNILTYLILELLRCCVDFHKRQYHQRLYQRLREYRFEHITISRGVHIGCNICLWDNVKTLCQSVWSKKCSWNTEITEKKQKVTTLYQISETESARTALPEILLKLSGTHSW